MNDAKTVSTQKNRKAITELKGGMLLGAGIGWMYSYACNALDNNQDLRKKELPEIYEKAINDLAEDVEDLINADNIIKEGD